MVFQKPSDSVKSSKKTEIDLAVQSRFIDPVLLKRIKTSLSIPLPQADEFWRLQTISGKKIGQRGMLGLFKKKGINPEQLSLLRNQATQSPGNTKVSIQKLMEKHGKHPSLLMLNAICAYGMILNSSSSQGILQGLRHACHDAATSLLSDQISIFNCECFLKIYFAYLDRLKREQIKVFALIRHDAPLEGYKKKLVLAMQTCDQLKLDEPRIKTVFNHLKKKIKTSSFTTNITYFEISKAAQFFEQGRKKEEVGLGKADEMIAYIYSLSSSFSRLPLLEPLVDLILQQIPSNDLYLTLRKLSIISTRRLTRFKLAMIEGNVDTMRSLGKTIYRDNYGAIKKREGQTITQVFECDPYFNLAIIAELGQGLFEKKIYLQMIDHALEGLQTVISLDMSKKHIFTDAANTHTHKLNNLKYNSNEAEGDEGQ